MPFYEKLDLTLLDFPVFDYTKQLKPFKNPKLLIKSYKHPQVAQFFPGFSPFFPIFSNFFQDFHHFSPWFSPPSARTFGEPSARTCRTTTHRRSGSTRSCWSASLARRTKFSSCRTRRRRASDGFLLGLGMGVARSGDGFLGLGMDFFGGLGMDFWGWG